MQPKDLSADHHARRCRKTLPERIRNRTTPTSVETGAPSSLGRVTAIPAMSSKRLIGAYP
jgi:hypothetical protein